MQDDVGDEAFGLTVIGMLLVSPVTWDRYLLLLLLPLAFTWVRLRRLRMTRWLWFAHVGAFLLPPEWVWRGLIPRGLPWGTATPVLTLTALSFQCYALCGLFVLALTGNAWGSRLSRLKHKSSQV